MKQRMSNTKERLLAILRLARKYDATDIHFTKNHEEMDIQMRIDGYLRKVKGKLEDYKLVRYLEYLSNLDSGSQMPQTAQFEIDVDGNAVPLRFAIINKNESSCSVLRILR